MQVAVNDGPAVELTATETGDNTGTFTKEVDTSAKTEQGKLTVKPGDRIYCRYIDEQNTIPGHAGVSRETVVYVKPNRPRAELAHRRDARPPRQGRQDAAARSVYLLRGLTGNKEAKMVAGVAFEARR